MKKQIVSFLLLWAALAIGMLLAPEVLSAIISPEPTFRW
jgi:hypothetical protein